MNPSLTKNIAQSQLKRTENFTRTYAAGEAIQVDTVVRRIAQFKLARKPDKHGDCAGWFGCINQAQLVENLQPSPDQAQFLGSVTLKLRVMTSLHEGPKARLADLFCFETPDADQHLSHLFSVVALSSADTAEGFSKIYVPTVVGLVTPTMPEFRDLEAIIDSFA